jgi:hypothetical protein
MVLRHVFACTTLSFACLAGCSTSTPRAPTAPQTAASITITHRPPSVGTTVMTRGTKTEETQGKLSAEGQEQASSTKAREDQERSEEILATADGRATKLRVTYKTRSASAEDNGQRKEATAPVVGKSYVVTRDGPNVVVSGGDGGTVAAEEVAIVAKDFKGFGLPDQLLDSIPSRALRVGDRIDEMAQGLRREWAERDDGGAGQASDPQVVLADVRSIDGERCGIFDIRFGVTGAVGQMHVDVKVATEIAVREKDGWLAQAELTTDEQMSGTTEKSGTLVHVSSHGTTSMKENRTYR